MRRTGLEADSRDIEKMLLHLQVSPHGRSFVPDAPPVLVDLRSDHTAARRDPVDGACRLPIQQLEERLFELPPPGEWPLTLIGTRGELDAAHSLLGPKGWTAEEMIIPQADDGSGSGSSSGGSTLSSPASPYRANSFLAAALPALELQGADASGLAVDLGCGSGRDAIYMASLLAELAPSWSVLGIDNHVAALGRGRALARRVQDEPFHHCDHLGRPRPPLPVPAAPARSASFEAADLRKGGLEAALAMRPTEPLRLVHGCRWLDLKLLASLPDLLAPGGLLLWSTFLDPPDGSPPLRPPYRRSRRLSSGQMRQVIGEDAGMRVLCDVEGELLTRGTWCTAQFYCAQRE